MEIVKTYFEELIRLVNEMSPYLLLGFLFAGILRVFFPRRIITRYMGKRNFRSVLNASLLGVPMPLCSCGVLPAGIGFYKNGASRGSTISFLISTPQTGVDSIFATYALLGLPLAIIRPVVALLTGIFGGVMGNLSDRNGVKEKQEVSAEENNHDRSVRELFRYGFVELLQDISKWLIIGMLVAALLSVLIPDDFFIRSISSEYLALLLMLLASVPLYICATGSIPIAAVLLMKGLSPGAALVLLMAGPATNIATMAVIGNAMDKRSLWIYLVSIIGGALVFGILVNELIPREWITGFIPSGLHSDVHEHTTGWFKWISSAALLLLIINGYIMKSLSRRGNRIEDKTKSEQMKSNIHIFRVEGMTCNHCKVSVENGLKKNTSISEVLADPDQNRVTIQAETITDSIIQDTVEGLGYSFKGRI
ncbi:MAG: permease [Bacteroidales bacterium]|nr:permease [Bacteroidales bacterium]